MQSSSAVESVWKSTRIYRKEINETRFQIDETPRKCTHWKCVYELHVLYARVFTAAQASVTVEDVSLKKFYLLIIV